MSRNTKIAIAFLIASVASAVIAVYTERWIVKHGF
jgi:hypothetical protein